MSRIVSFLDAIRGRPDDDAPRLIFADWLDEQGDPRGEFIRVQCALARQPGFDQPGQPFGIDLSSLLGIPAGLLGHADVFRRQAADAVNDPRGQALEAQSHRLLEQHLDAWLWPWRMTQAGWSFHRGLLRITAEAEDFLRVAGAAPEAVDWLDQLTLANVTRPAVQCLAGCPHLPRAVRLEMQCRSVGPEGASLLAASPHMARLTRLYARRNQIGDAGAAALAASPGLPRITWLDLSCNEIGPAGAAALAELPHLPLLTSLILNDNELGAVGAAALAGSPLLARLAELGLSANDVGDAGAAALAASPFVAGLAQLGLGSNSISEAGAAALADSPRLAGLAHLNLSWNPDIGANGAALLRGRFGRRVEVHA